MQQSERIHDRAIGRWRSILPALGIHERFLTGKHCPCPICGGNDRFRWDDKAGSGSYICNQCGAGSGVDLVMKVKGLRFIEAVKAIEEKLPVSRLEVPKARLSGKGFEKLADVWHRAEKLNGSDPASLYLVQRGIKFEGPITAVRFLRSFPYFHDDKSRTDHPAMVSLFVASDRSEYTLQYTYLTADGQKADVPRKRKLAPKKIPKGGAVRLFSAADTMGIAEGVETAIAAQRLFDVPVWSALNANNLVFWHPPEIARNIIVFGDNDKSATGQSAAWSLAHGLIAQGLNVEVRIPDEAGTDWNDVLQSEQSL